MTIDGMLARQAGLITREQALRCGLPRAAVDHRIRLRHWRPLHPRVYLASPGSPTDEVRVRAAMLWAGSDAVLCGAAAAWWHGLGRGAPDTLTIAVGRRRPAARPGMSLCLRERAAADITVRRGIPLTSLPLALLDAAVELGTEGEAMLDRGLRSTAVALPDVRAALTRSRRPDVAARLLAAAAARSASVARRLLIRLLRDRGITGWRPGPPNRVLFPASGVTVEVSGWAEPAPAGPLRFHWSDLTGRPGPVLAAIAEAVAT